MEVRRVIQRLPGRINLARLHQVGGFLLLLTAGFLLGNARIIPDTSPFGIAFLTALYVVDKDHLIAGTLGVLAGNLSLAVTNLISVLVMASIMQTLQLNVKAVATRVTPLVAVGTYLSVRSVQVLLEHPSPYILLPVLWEALVALTLSLTFVEALSLIRGKAVLQPEWNSRSILSIGVFLCSLLVGTSGLQVGSLSVLGILGRAVALTMAYAGGPGSGAVVGTVFGMIFFLSGAGDADTVGLFGFSGLLAGLFSEMGKIGSATGFIVAHILFSAALGHSFQIANHLYHVIASALLFLVLPKTVSGRMNKLFKKGDTTSLRDIIKQRLSEFAGAFEEVAAAFEEASTGCKNLDKGISEALSAISNRVCADCSKVRQCWESDFYRTYSFIVDMMSQEDARTSKRTKKGFHCAKIQELQQAVYGLNESLRINSYWRMRFEESRDLVCHQLRGMGQVARQITDVLAPEHGRKTGPVPRSGYEIGVAQLASDGSTVSGDFHRAIRLSQTRIAVIVSDGMGTGEAAAKESKTAVTLLERLLLLGLDRLLALKTVNSVMVLRSTDDQYVTVDLVIVDLYDMTAEITKMGAVPSFLVRLGEVRTVRLESPPLGVVHNPEILTYRTRIRSGDRIVIMTDGVFCRIKDCQESSLFTRALTEVERMSAEDGARYILRTLRERTAEDDMTAIVVAII